MKNNTRKILIALLLVFTMMMSLGAVTSYADDSNTGDTVTIYFQNNWLWTDVSCYYWGSTTGTNPEWPGQAMNVIGTQEGYDVYSLDVPSDVTGLIINGIKNDGSGNLDQTPDITDGIVDGAGWKMVWTNGNAVEAFTYDPSSEPTEDSYTVAGVSALCGTDWDVKNTANDLVLGNDGVYSITYKNVAAGEYEFKVVMNHSWAKNWPSSNYVLSLAETADVTISFDPATEQLNVTTSGTGSTPVEPTPTPSADEYYLAGWINGADVGIAGDASNLGPYKFDENGKLTVNLTSDSYVVVKTGENVGYWAEAYCTATSVVLQNTNTTGAGEKLFVPMGQVTFTLTKGEGDTLVLSYGEGGGAGSGTPSEPVDNPIQPENGYYTIYLWNTAYWTLVDYYVWDAEGAVLEAWPGQPATEADDCAFLYSAKVSEGFVAIIFNDGNNIQTVDLYFNAIEEGKNVYDNAAKKWISLDEVDKSFVPEEPKAPTFDEYETIRVYLGNSAGWSNANYYVWGGEFGTLSGWPGLPMEYDDAKGMFYADVPSCFVNIIFNDGASQTADLLLPALGSDKIVCDNTIASGTAGGSQLGDGVDPWFTLEGYEAPAPILPPDEDVTVAVKNEAGWDEVYIHFWGGETASDWNTPVHMELGEEGYFYYVVPAGTTHLLFHNGAGEQTSDLLVPTDGNTLYDNASGKWESLGGKDDNPSQGGDNKPSEPDNTPDGTPDDEPVDDKPVGEMTFLQKIAKAILLFLRQIEEFFKNLFSGSKE